LEIYGNTSQESQDTAYSIHKDLLNYGVIAGRGSATKNVLRIQPPMIIEEKDVRIVSAALELCAINHRKK
jgi:4-aminobutyrate aminotransferase-like enzyme